MKNTKVWLGSIVGLALTASCFIATRSVVAEPNGEVHVWSSGYYPTDRTMYEPTVGTSSLVGTGSIMHPGTRMYFVNDEPAYDLSGAWDHWFLLGDGTAYNESSWRTPAAFARAGMVPREGVQVSAEYRQDWLAVAAGDRPVRTLTPRGRMESNAGSYLYTSTGYTGNGTQYRAQPLRKKTYVHRNTSAVRTTAVTSHRTYRRHRAAKATPVVATRYHAPRTVVVTRYNPPPTRVATTELAVDMRRDELGNELFQVNSSWYRRSNGDWYRAQSWRGPFVHVKRGSVPREVRMSADHKSRLRVD